MAYRPSRDPFPRLPALQVDLARLRRYGSSWAVVLLVLAALFTSVYTVQPEGRAVVKRFGRVVSVRPPGLHFKLPFGVDRAVFVPTEMVLKEEFGFRTRQAAQRTQYDKAGPQQEESLMLTGDLNVIDVEWVVQFRIRDPDLWLHRVRDQRGAIRDIAEAVMRRIVGNRLGSDVLTVGRVEIAAQARSEMQAILDAFELGVDIATVEMQDVTPPDSVKPAFNEVNEARQERERLINEAEKRRNQVVPRAEGEARQIIAEAEGDAAERVNRAHGEASRFTSVLAAYRAAPEVTRRRLYVETQEAVLSSIGRLYLVDQGQVMPLPLLNLPAGEAPVKGGRP